MKREIAEELIAAYGKALDSLTEAEYAVRRIDEEGEWRPLYNTLTEVMGDIMFKLRLPVLRQFPDLNRSKRPDQPDPELSEDEQQRVAVLSSADLDLIDTTLLSNCKARSLKVFHVAMKTEQDLDARLPTIPLIYYAQRIASLVAAGRLKSRGDLRYMGFSEVWLAEADSATELL